MPVLIRENRITSVLRDVSPLLRVVTSFFSILLLFLVWTFFLYLPANNRISQFRAAIHNLRQKKVVLSAGATRKVESYTLQQNIDFVLDTAYKNKLACKKFSPLGRGNFTLVAKGRFFDVVAFFESFNNLDRNINPEKFSLDGSDGLVELTTHFKIFDNK